MSRTMMTIQPAERVEDHRPMVVLDGGRGKKHVCWSDMVSANNTAVMISRSSIVTPAKSLPAVKKHTLPKYGKEMQPHQSKESNCQNPLGSFNSM
jgi:hypothetical protein